MAVCNAVRSRGGGATRHCPFKFTDDTNAFFSEARQLAFDAVCKGYSTACFSRRSHTAPRIVKVAIELIRRHGLLVYPTDKDGGFAICDRSRFCSSVESVLSSEDYNEVQFTDFTALDAFESYQAACREVAKLYNSQKVLKALMSDSKYVARLCAELQLTIKTHKALVPPRQLHAYSQHCMAPGMRWMSGKLRACLSLHQHMFRDTDHMISQLRRMKFPSPVKFIKFDIADFFMTGRHSELVSLSSSILPQDVQPAYRSIASAVLSAQHVKSKLLPGRVWRTLRGAGTGMIPSGDIADATFSILLSEITCFATVSDGSTTFCSTGDSKMMGSPSLITRKTQAEIV
eukprot:TRINITY_DN113799_c0_g1_i1.p1 TRINITY_DN113799_c0_g1~~TRINITY_DN113799_c0_g1_i1.p1  ORF type:complete len:345 (+),score=16.55 TRINITY_DN113799_c0_g1_i1:325-1359(+)